MRAYIYIVLLLFLSSCGIFRKVHKESTLDKIESSSVIKADSTAITIDKSITTVKEKADTAVIIPGKIVTQEVVFSMDSLVNGMTAVKNELIDIRFTLNPLTHKLSTIAVIKPQAVSFSVNKETTKANDITSLANVSKSEKDNHKEEHKISLVDKKPANSIWFVVIIIGVVCVITGAITWLINKKLKVPKT